MNNDEKLTIGCLVGVAVTVGFAIYGIVEFLLWMIEVLT